jgi:heptosyltransferase-2
MTEILVIKTGALGDVLRTTAILPGLHGRFGAPRVTWLTAPSARPLVEGHPQVAQVLTCRSGEEASIRSAAQELGGRRWDWVLSLDDEQSLCELAAGLDAEALSGATLDDSGERAYTDDVEPWFGMGLLARDGKEAADRRKVQNQRTHPAIFADMLGVEEGRSSLPLPADARAAADAFARSHGLFADELVVGLNTGAGGRWASKGLPPARVVQFAAQFTAAQGRPVHYLVLGGRDERGRNDELLAGIGALDDGSRAIDAGTENDLLTFASLLALSDVMVTSDSLALHLGLATQTRVVAFFAPTSAAEIELYGLGEKVVSTAPDYCSYRPDADNATITAERLVAAAERVMARPRPGARRAERRG